MSPPKDWRGWCSVGEEAHRMRVYISGPMTGLPGHNFPAFYAAAERLTAAGYEVENPAEKGVIEGWSWEDYLRHDLRLLLDCDAIYMLPFWRSSRGACLERHVAGELGLRVMGQTRAA